MAERDIDPLCLLITEEKGLRTAQGSNWYENPTTETGGRQQHFQ